MSDERSHFLKLPRAVQAAAERLAHADGVSLDQFLETAVAEKVGSLDTVDRFLRQRAAGYEPANLHDVLSAVPDTDPIEEDERWPLSGEHRKW